MNAWKIISLVGILAAVAALAPAVEAGITIDGVAEIAYYGSAISTQALGTTALDNTLNNIGLANGSELDAAYGFISNGVLYLVMAGNFDSTIGVHPNDTLHVFFMSDAGGTDYTLGDFYNGTWEGRINSMAGMTFDAGFTPNHWIGVNVGLDSVTSNLNMYVDYMKVCSNCPSAFLGSVVPTNDPPSILTNVYYGSVMQFALDNSNMNGVDATTYCTTNSTGVLQSVAASAVRSGIEMAVPLATIGNPTGTVRVCAFLTDQLMIAIYNQALGPFNDVVPYCLNFSGIYTSLFNFNTYPGQHYFSIPVPPCDVILFNPTSASYTSTGGVGSVTVTNSGGCAIMVTNPPWLTVTSTPGLSTGKGSFTYSVAPNTNSINIRTGQFIISNTEASGNIVTQIVTITQTGVYAPRLSSTFDIDGIAEADYGCPLSVQQIQTGFGDSITNNHGSELDAAYGMIENDVLFLVLAGNLENNNNKLDIFFMTGPGGQNTLTSNNPDIDFNGLNNMGLSINPAAAGLTFHAGFAPNYWIGANGGGVPYAFNVNYAQLVQGGTNSGAVGYFLGSTTSTNGTLVPGEFGYNPFGIQATINDSNTNGVDGGTCATNVAGQVQSTLAASVRTGIELGIPLGALGSPTGTIAVVAFVSNDDHTYMSNQMLPPLGTNDLAYCQGKMGAITNTRAINLNNYPGEAYFRVGPEMRIKGISQSGTAINVSYQTAANTNLIYRLQRTSALTTNTQWTNVGTPIGSGTGGILTGTDSFGATNKARFYRVWQIPLCP